MLSIFKKFLFLLIFFFLASALPLYAGSDSVSLDVKYHFEKEKGIKWIDATQEEQEAYLSKYNLTRKKQILNEKREEKNIELEKKERQKTYLKKKREEKRRIMERKRKAAAKKRRVDKEKRDAEKKFTDAKRKMKMMKLKSKNRH
jgi:hypothetical protein